MTYWNRNIFVFWLITRLAKELRLMLILGDLGVELLERKARLIIDLVSLQHGLVLKILLLHLHL